MKKVLILAYDFPPFVSVGGLRPYGWFKYLRSFGIYPIIVTRQWRNTGNSEIDYISKSYESNTIFKKSISGLIIETPYKQSFSNKLFLKHGKEKHSIIRKLLTGFNEVFQYILPLGTKRQLYIQANEYIKNNKIDAIVATGDPFILFHYAIKLSKKHSIPAILDYRDLWSNDISMKNRPLFSKWSEFFEMLVLKKASAITTVSDFLLGNIQKVYKKNNYRIIRNGYDQGVFEKIKNIEQNNIILSIGFAGTIYQWHPLNIFFNQINQVLSENPNFNLSLNFYGINDKTEQFNMILSKYPKIQEVINVFPKLLNLDLQRKMKKDNLLLLFNDYSFLGTKIFDYLALERTILFCFKNDKGSKELKLEHFKIQGVNEDLQEKVIIETNSGIILKDANHLKEILIEYIKAFQRNKKIECLSKNIEQYSRKVETSKLARLINELT